MLAQTANFGLLGPVCRLGFAAHYQARLTLDDVHLALARGVNFLNWPGTADYLSEAIAELGERRKDVIICAQLEARGAAAAEAEFAAMLRTLRTDYIDILTFYYVEQAEEWAEIAGPGSALAYCREARQQGRVHMLGLTSHQRPLAASIAQTGLIDMLMIRYNAGHRGAEREIFPVTDALKMPVVTYTSLRWGGLLEATPDDPSGFTPPSAPDWYRFVLQNPAVTVALMAPCTRAELQEDLTVLSDWRPLSAVEYERLAQHGLRVRRHGGAFP